MKIVAKKSQFLTPKCIAVPKMKNLGRKIEIFIRNGFLKVDFFNEKSLKSKFSNNFHRKVFILMKKIIFTFSTYTFMMSYLSKDDLMIINRAYSVFIVCYRHIRWTWNTWCTKECLPLSSVLELELSLSSETLYILLAYRTLGCSLNHKVL